MKTAGVIFDFYDDPEGVILKNEFPTPPGIFKEAHILSPEEREVLRDEAYALIMRNDGVTLRKFACVDPANTLMSAAYLFNTHDKLPPAAIKVAAANICSFMEDFALEPSYLYPEMAKLAEKSIKAKDRDAEKKPTSGMARNRDPMRQPIVGDEADWSNRTNLLSVSGGADSGKVVPTAQSMKTGSINKEAYLGPENIVGGLIGYNEGKKQKARGEKHSFGGKQIASLLIPGGAGYQIGRYAGHENGKKDEKKEDMLMGHQKLNPEAKQKTSSIVDVTGQAPVMKFEKKAAKRTALGDSYSLDSMRDVETAINYFSDYVFEMSPADRHEYAVKTAARAEELGMTVPEMLQRYGSTEYALDLEAHLANRRAVAPDFKPVWDALQEKKASVDPEAFAALLGLADKEAGLNWYYGGQVQDNYYATFGGKDSLQKLADSSEWKWENGAVQVNADQLIALSERKEDLAAKFDSHLVDGFCKDPIQIFDSLPADHKAILASMAAKSGATNAPSDD